MAGEVQGAARGEEAEGWGLLQGGVVGDRNPPGSIHGGLRRRPRMTHGGWVWASQIPFSKQIGLIPIPTHVRPPVAASLVYQNLGFKSRPPSAICSLMWHLMQHATMQFRNRKDNGPANPTRRQPGQV